MISATIFCCAKAVVYDDLTAKLIGQLQRERMREHVGCAAGAGACYEADGFGGVVGRVSGDERKTCAQGKQKNAIRPDHR